MPWSDGGARVIATTSATLSWQRVAAALAAASTGRTAVLSVDDTADRFLDDQVATVVRMRSGAGAPAAVEDVVAVARVLARTHGLVLVGGAIGPLEQLGGAGWALADLCWPLAAPVIVVTGPDPGPDPGAGTGTGTGPDCTDRTAAVLAALARRAIPASVVVIDDGTPLDLPVVPARRVDATPRPARVDYALRQARVGMALRQAKAGATPRRPLVGVVPRRVSRSRCIVAAVVATVVVAACGYAAWGPARAVSPHSSTSAPHPVTVGGHDLGVTIPEHLQRSAAAWPRHTSNVGSRSSGRAATAACPRHAHVAGAARPDPSTVARVDAAWTRIESWLSRHAPKDYRTLRAPATPERIAALQDSMSVAFPADLVASLLRHDGSRSGGFALPASFHLFSVDEILEDWTSICVVLANNSTEPEWYDPAFVPFAGASDGGCLVVDQRPTGHGRVGEFYADEGVTFDDWPASVGALLEELAHALETGANFATHYRPVTTHGRLSWQFLQGHPTPTSGA